MSRAGGFGSGTDTSSVVRVVVLGDSGTGKSALIRRLIHQLGGSCSPAHGTTVGAHIEAVVWPASVAPADHHARSTNGGGGGNGTQQQQPPQRPVVIEFVEMGGNRGFTAAARSPFFASCSAAILVYAASQEESRKSLVAWFNELETARAALHKAGGGSGLPTFAIVGTQTNAGASQPGRVMAAAGGGHHPMMPAAAAAADPEGGGLHQPAADETAIEAVIVARVPALAPVVAGAKQALSVVSGIALLVLSFVLLGRFVVPWAGVSAAKAISHIESRANSSAAATGASGGGAGVSMSRSQGEDEGSAMLRRVGAGNGGASMSQSPTSQHAGGSSPYFGHVEGVSLATDRDFAATGEGLFDFISDAVRSNSPASSRSSGYGA